jgi:hypothetical protein
MTYVCSSVAREFRKKFILPIDEKSGRYRVVASYLRIFMAYGKDKALEKNEKFEVLPSGVWSFHDKHRGMPMVKTLLKTHFFS